MTQETQASPSSPGVQFPPPLLFVVGFGAAWLVERQFSAPLAPRDLDVPLDPMGRALFLGGLALMFWGIVTFHRAKTAVYPNQPASALVGGGPYRFTRNPMYVGLTIAYLGGVASANSVWPLAVLPLVLLGVYRFVIRREERYLESEFGDAYREYCARVRRWL